MNLMELLLLVDARLKPLLNADESALEAVFAEVAAGPRPAGVVPDVEPRTVLAIQLMGIEEECRLLREHLHVQLTVATQMDVKIVSMGPVRHQSSDSHDARSTSADQNEPD